MIPGQRLRKWARCVCSDDTMVRVIDPVVADMQHETAGASRAGRARRLWVLANSYLAFWRVVVFHVPLGAMRRMWESANADAPLGPAMAAAAVTLIVLTGLLVAPPAPHLPGRTWSEFVWLLVLLLPQALALSIPIALFVGLLCALRRRTMTAGVRRVLSVLAIATSVGMFFIINWLVPASNQAFREARAGRYVLEGPAELSLLDVRREAQSLKRQSRPRPAGRLLLVFHQRVALAAAPLVLTLLAVGLCRARMRVAALVATTACSVFLAWTFEVSNMDRAMLGHEWVAIALAWFPHVLLIATSMGLLAIDGGRTGRSPADADTGSG